MKRLLVTGAAGFMGGRLVRDLAGRYDLFAARRVDGDLGDAAAVAALLERARPDAVLHCAAVADPDTCEKDAARARAVNAESPGLIAAWCAARGARLIHVSTDLVFDGTAAPYAEDAAPAPMSEYGRTKLEGERRVLAAYPAAAVVRVSLVYGRSTGRASFLDWLLAELAAERKPKLFSDQFRTPTPAFQLAEAFARLIERPAVGGLLHWAGGERVSRVDFGRVDRRLWGFPDSALEPTRLADFPYAAARPRDVSLDCRKMAAAIELEPAGLEAGLSAER